ncbi:MULTISPECIES: thiamine pyrophosphate-dependent enzyme [unclassified Streptomyces]|uniref:thiamine pyrophosphate-dependent enzyme n=1 Tax=unclassified Streptomyces TaxID=2593676 RepID=UPI0033B30898
MQNADPAGQEVRDGGEAVVSAFQAMGADCLFSSPGSEWAPVWEALARRRRDGSDHPRYLNLAHESVAVSMAVGYALITRRPQGVLLHAGAGLLQGAFALHGALQLGVPIVAASAHSTTYGDGPGPGPGYQWYSNPSLSCSPDGMARPFVKWAGQAASLPTVYASLTRAAEIAARAPAGPVYVTLSQEALQEPWSGHDCPPVPARGRTVSAMADQRALIDLLAGAERPVVVAERLGLEDGGMEALVAFCEAFAVPVIESQALCVNFPATHPLHAGSDLSSYLAASDLVLLASCQTPFFPPARRPTRARIVALGEAPQRPHLIHQVLHADLYLEGGAVQTLHALAQHGDAVPAQVRSSRQQAQAAERHARQAADTRTESEAAAGTALSPVLVAALLRDLLADTDSVIVDETTRYSPTLRRHLRPSSPDSYFRARGGLGQGIPVSLGIKLAAPERPVVLLVGDGGFFYNPVIPGLQAARANGLPLLIVVLNNHRYQAMQAAHTRLYPQGAAAATGDFLGAELDNFPSPAGFAPLFGMHGECVTRPDELASALERAVKALHQGTGAIVDVSMSE